MNEKFLACGNCGNCPEVQVTDENVTIRDDFGGSVKMSRSQTDKFVEEYQKITKK